MREIRFRAWMESQKRMLYWEQLCTTPDALVDALNRVYLHDVMQYTGLKDKNGKEIYEGDIVNVKGTKRIGRYTTFVIYESQGFKLNRNNTKFVDSASLIGVTVIGNIYENPELLENNLTDKEE